MNQKGVDPFTGIIVGIIVLSSAATAIYVGCEAYNSCPPAQATLAQCETYVSENFPGIPEGSNQYNDYVNACMAGNWPAL